MKQIVWLLLIVGWAQDCSPYFFNNPEKGHFKTYSDETYVDYIKKRDAILNPECEGTLTFEATGRTIDVTQEGDKKILKLNTGDEDAPALQMVFDICFAGLKVTNSDMFDGDKTKFKDCEVNTVTKEAKCRGDVDEIKFANKFEAKDVVLEFEWFENGEADRFSLEKIAVGIKGDVDVIHELSEFEAHKKFGTLMFIINKFDLKALSPNLNIVAYINGIDSDVDEMAFAAESQDLNAPLFSRIQWTRGFKGIGKFYPDNKFQLMLMSRVEVANTPPFNESASNQTMFLNGETSGDVTAALLAEFESTEPLGQLMNEIFTSSTTSFKAILNRVNNRKWCACFAKEYIDLDISYLRDVFKERMSACFINEVEPPNNKADLLAGVSLKVQVDIKGNTSKCIEEHPNEDAQSIQDMLDSIPVPCALTGVKRLIGFKWKFAQELELPVGIYLGCVTGVDEFFDLPPNIFGIENRGHLTDFYYAPVNGNMDCRINFRISPKELMVPATNLRIESVDFTFERFEGETLASVTAEIISNGTDFATLIRCENKDGFKTYVCTIAVPSFTMERMLTDIFQKPDLLKNDIFNAASILKTGIKDLVIVYTWGTNQSFVRIRGEVLYPDFEGVFLEVIIVKEGGFAFGFYASDIDLEAVIKKYVPNPSAVSLPWLTRMEGKLVFSNFAGATAENKTGTSADRTAAAGSGTKLWSGSTLETANHGKSGSRKKTKVLTNKEKSKRMLDNTTIKRETKSTNSVLKHSVLKKNKKHSRSVAAKRHSRYQNLHKRTGITHTSTGGHIYRGSQDTSDIQFESPSFFGFNLQPGFAFEFIWKTPKTKCGCFGDACCEFLFDKLDDASLTLGGVFQSNGKWTLTAALGAEIEIVENLTFESGTLEITWGPDLADRSVMFSTELVYTDHEVFGNPLRFYGMVKFTFAGTLTFQFGMRNMVNEPFGITNFALGNLVIGADIDFKQGSVVIVLGGQVHIGQNLTSATQENFDENILSIAIVLGIDPRNPANCWIYSRANALTLGKIGRAFGNEEIIPVARREDGFPEGYIFSVSKEAQFIDAIELEVSEGVRFKGKFKFWEVEGSADITLKPAKMEYNLDLELEMINWLDGQIQITRLTDKTKGPYLKVICEPTKFSADIDGRIYIFGLNYAARVKIGGADFLIEFEGSLFPGIFDVNFKIAATMGAGTKFQGGEVTIGFKTTDFISTITEYLLSFLTTTKDEAVTACEESDTAVATAEADQTAANVESANLTKSIEDWQAQLKIREKELEAKQEMSDSINECKVKCERVCYPFADWNSECFTVWGTWVGCPEWNSCFSMIDDLICLGGCVVNAVKNAFVTWVESTINKIAMAMTTVASALTTVVDGVVDAAKKLGELAEALKTLVTDGIKAIAEFAINSLNLKIYKLELQATLSSNFRLCFNYWINITVLDEPHISKYEHELCLDEILKYITEAICNFAEELKAFLGFPKAVEEVKGQQEGITAAKKELTESQTTSEAEVEMKTAEKFNDELEQRSKLPRREMFHFINKLRSKYNNSYSDKHRAYLHTPHHMDSYEIQDPELTTAYETNAPWIHSANYDPLSHNFKPTIDETEQYVSKRSYIEGENQTPCSRMKRSLSNYADISNKISKSMSKVREMKHHIKVVRRDHISKLAKFYQQTHKIGTMYEDMNEHQRSDIYHWYNKISKGYKKHAIQTKRHFIQHNHNALPILRSQINYALKHNFNTSFEHMIGDMHTNAVESYKRSVIPTPEGVEGEKVLHYIKDSLLEIVTNEDAPITHFQGKLNNVNAAIREMNKYTMQCQNNVSK